MFGTSESAGQQAGNQDRSLAFFYYSSDDIRIRASIYDGATKTVESSFGVPFQSKDNYVTLIASCSDGYLRVFLNGVGSTETAVSNNGFTGYSAPYFNVYTDLIGTTVGYDIGLVARIHGKGWKTKEAAAFHANPWQLFSHRRIYIPYAAATGAVTGTLARTNAADTSAASGTTTVTGTSARTNAADTSAASGTTTVVGTLAKTNAADTSAASGAVGSDISGTVSTTNAADTSAASGTTTIVGTSARTNAADTSAASGTTTVTGTSATTNAADTATASGVAGAIEGSAAVTNANDTVSAEGFVGAEAPRRNQGAGKSKRRTRKPVVVEIDGEDFVVSSEEEAEALVANVKAEAEEVAQLAMTRAATVQKRPPRKVLQDARRALVVPSIQVSGDDAVADIMRAAVSDVQELYQSAMRSIEIGALMRKQAQEQDEEDVLMLLL